ncbi:WD40-repeat-containing domain protein [Pelagophyceae sp. CCMP2097]|nr:WD40-repeat-containing domain protein [Pelagophyceae sp. CCMP2097]
MDVGDAASRPIKLRRAVPVLAVFEQTDLVKIILRLAAEAPNALLVTKGAARDAPAVALALRRLVWQDRILKGTAIFEGHTDSTNCCAFSPDGKRLVTASDDGTARLWDAETGALQATLEGHTGGVDSCACAFSPSGERIVTASYDETAQLWDAKTGAMQATLEGHTSGVAGCAFSSDGTRVVTASYDKTARLWSVVL